MPPQSSRKKPKASRKKKKTPKPLCSLGKKKGGKGNKRGKGNYALKKEKEDPSFRAGGQKEKGKK